VHDSRTTTPPNGNGIYGIGNNNLFDGCQFYNLKALGLRLWKSGGGSETHDNIVRNCIAFNNSQLGEAEGGGYSIGGNDNFVYNCIAYDHNTPLAAGFEIRGDIVSNRNHCYNLTSYNNSEGLALRSGGSDHKVRNVVCYSNSVNYDNSATGTTQSNNSTSGTDPKFVAPGSGNFRIQSDSPLRNAGFDLSTISLPAVGSQSAATGFFTDYYGATRPLGGTYDIGAAEFVE